MLRKNTTNEKHALGDREKSRKKTKKTFCLNLLEEDKDEEHGVQTATITRVLNCR